MDKKNNDKFGTVVVIRKIGISSERLRYWEKVGIVQPEYVQCGTRQFRRYSKKDIECGIFVKKLVDEEKYSLEGAKIKLQKRANKFYKRSDKHEHSRKNISC